MSELKVVFEVVPSRWRVENRIRDGRWIGDQCFPTLEDATAYAQRWLDNDPSVYEYRVVDTRPEAPHIPDEAVEAAWKVMEPLFLGMNRERCRDSLILAFRAAMPYLVPDMSGEDFYVRPRQQRSKHVI